MFNLRQIKDLFRLNPNKNNKNITIKCYLNDRVSFITNYPF
ncbi:MAG: hypothetical protein JWQ63_4294 [Mucilaginibacter sp.]|jgi:hypothetical protein|nr:hypothetical protein [Mucilaginibacter sp.]